MSMRAVARGLLAALIGWLAIGGVAQAHGSPPLRVVSVSAGPYPLLVGLYADPPRAGQVLGLTVTLPTNAGSGMSLALSAAPGPGTDAVRVPGRIAPDGEEAGVWAGSTTLSVRGAWILEISVRGSAGEGVARVPVVAAEEGAIAEPLAWAIGLAPLAALVLFGLSERRRLAAVMAEGPPRA